MMMMTTMEFKKHFRHYQQQQQQQHQREHRHYYRDGYNNRLLLLLFVLFIYACCFLNGAFAIYGLRTIEMDVDDVPNASMIFTKNDPNEYLRFLAYEHHFGFVGGHNNLMVLNMTASVEERRLVWRDLWFPKANETNDDCLTIFDDEEEKDIVCRSTYVRAIFRRPSDDSVVFCGIGSFLPRCWFCKDSAQRQLHKASDLYDFKADEQHMEEIARGIGKGIVPLEAESNFTSFISDGVIYSGIYETAEVNSAIFQPVVVARPLAELDLNATEETISRTVIAEPASFSRPKFVSSIDGGDVGYMFFNEQKAAKVAQFCKHGPTAVGTTGTTVSASFFKAFLFCGFAPQPKVGTAAATPLNVETLFSNSNPPFRFEHLADITPLSDANDGSGSRYFYGAFNRDPDAPSSIGICIFDESQLRQLFAKSPFVRLSASGGHFRAILPVAYGNEDEDLPFRPNNCSAKFSDADKVPLHNFRVKYTTLYRLATMLNTEPVFYDTTVSYRLTTIAVDWNTGRNFQHMLFVGTDDGRLLRLLVDLRDQDSLTVTTSFGMRSLRSATSPAKIETRLLSRVKMFNGHSPILRISTWPPGHKPNNGPTVTALLVVGRSSIGLHLVRSGEACGRHQQATTSCNCFAEGYPYCKHDGHYCQSAGNYYFDTVMNSTSCSSRTGNGNNGGTDNGEKTAVTTNGGDDTKVMEVNNTLINSGSTLIVIIVTIVGCTLVLSVVIVGAVCFFRRRRHFKGKRQETSFTNHNHNHTAYMRSPTTGSSPTGDSVDNTSARQKLSSLSPQITYTGTGFSSISNTKVTSEAATEMTPNHTPKSTLKAKKIYSHTGTLSRYGTKHSSSSRHPLLASMMPLSKSLPDQLNEDDYIFTDDDEEVASPSPVNAINNDNNINSNNNNSRVSPQEAARNDPAKTPGGISLPTPNSLYSGVVFNGTQITNMTNWAGNNQIGDTAASGDLRLMLTTNKARPPHN